MNDNWIEIVNLLQPYIFGDSTETRYQQEVEYCLRLLGWKSFNKTMRSQITINIGNNNSIRPDIVLYKNDSPVLPIEIKRPGNICKSRQEDQLKSYMRQLRLNVGLYIGKNIQIFYDNPTDLDNPVCVFKVELCKNDSNGEMFCEMMSYEKFDVNKLEKFCEKHYNQIIAHNSLQRRLDDFLSVDKASMNVMSLIKDKFVKEGFDGDSVEKELEKLVIQIKLKQQNVIKVLDIENTVKPVNKDIKWENKLKTKLKTLGLMSFIHLYPILKNNLDATIEDVVVKIPEFRNYGLSSQSTKLSTARSIFKSGWENEALLIVAKSKNVDEDILKQARLYLSNIK